MKFEGCLTKKIQLGPTFDLFVRPQITTYHESNLGANHVVVNIVNRSRLRLTSSLLKKTGEAPV